MSFISVQEVLPYSRTDTTTAWNNIGWKIVNLVWLKFTILISVLNADTYSSSGDNSIHEKEGKV